MMEGGGRDEPVPSRIARLLIFSPTGYFSRSRLPRPRALGLQMGVPLGSKAKFLAHGGYENRRKLLSILGTTIRYSLLENQNKSELFETITEQEAIFHGAT